MPEQPPSQNFNNLVALFLAEAIRSRRTSLPRAAEICHRVVSRLNGASSEAATLAMLTDIEKDFEEVTALKQALHFGYESSDLRVYEPEIKEYAAKIFTEDLKLSAAFLQDAARRGMSIQELCIKYPQFCDFLLASPGKSELLPELIPAE